MAGNPFDQFDTATSSNPFDQFDAPAPAGSRSYLGAAAVAGVHNLAGASARLLEAVTPGMSETEASQLQWKDAAGNPDPEGFKKFQESMAAGALARFARERAARGQEVMSEVKPADKAIGEKEYFTLDPEKSAFLSPTKMAGDALESLPSTLMLAAASWFTRGASKTAFVTAEKAALADGAGAAAARTAGIDAAKKAGAEAMTKIGASGEGALGYGQQYDQSLQAALKVPAAEYEQSPEYQNLVKNGLDPESARVALAHRVAESAAVSAGGVDAITNLTTGPVLGKVIGEGGKLAPRVAKGFATEAGQEALQGAGEQAGQNLAMRSIKPSQDLGEGVAESALQGLAVGGLTGGLAAGTFGHSSPARAAAAHTLATTNDVGEMARAAMELSGSMPEIDAELRRYMPVVPKQQIAAEPATGDTAPVSPISDNGTKSLVGDIPVSAPHEGAAAAYADLTPMTEMAAQQRQAVMRDQNAVSGREVDMVPHPAADGMFALQHRQLPSTELGGTAAAVETPDLRRAPPAAPPAAGVVEALRTEPFQRTAPQKVAVDQAATRLAPEDHAIVQQAARGPFALGLEERNRLKALGGPDLKSSTARTLETEAKRRGTTATIVDPATLPSQSAIRVSARGAQPITREVHAFVQRIGKVFGKTIVVYDGDMKMDGFVNPAEPDTIYLSKNSTRPHLVVLGHEITHQMKAQLGTAYSAFQAVVQRNAGEAGLAEHGKDYGTGADVEELSSDLMGNRFKEPAFWQDVFTEIDAKLGSSAAVGVVQRLGALISKAVNSATRAVMNNTGFKADAFVKNLDEVKTAARKALADYAVDRRQSAVREDVQRAREKRHAAHQRQQQAGLQQERSHRDEGGQAAEASSGNRLQQETSRIKASKVREEDHPVSAGPVIERTQPGHDRTQTGNNASGESAASAEAQSRLRDETARGRDRVLVRRDGTVVPLVTADRVDQRARTGEAILQRGVGRDEWTVLEMGPGASKARAIERAKSVYSTPTRAEQAKEIDESDSDFSLDNFVSSKYSPERIDAEAAKADPNPSGAQIEADVYRKGHIVVDGMDVSIETAKGTMRRSKPGTKPAWEVKMPAHYGDIKGTIAADGDNVDISIGDKGGNGRYWIIDQNTPAGEFDEHKVQTGVDSKAEALAQYKAGFADKFGDKIFRAISDELSADELKSALPSLEEKAPFNAAEPIKASKQRIAGDSKRAYTAAQKAMFGNVGRTVDVPTIKERIVALRKDLGKKMAIGIADQFAAVKELNAKSYNLLRLSKGSAGAVEAFLYHGKLSVGTDGSYDADTSGGFIDTIARPLHGETDDFMWWVAGHRAEQLSKEDRENLFTAEDIAAAQSLDHGKTDFDYTRADGTVTRDRAAIYKDALVKFDAFNKNALDVAEASGLIDPEARALWEHQFYVPFYRVSDDTTGFAGGNIKQGAVRQRAFKELKGGTDKLNADLLANTLQNWAHLIDASAKNRAAESTLEAAVNAGIATEASADTIRQMARSAGARKNTVWFMDQGKERHFLVEDPYILTALNGLEFAGLRGPLMDVMSSFKHWLTLGVTASPAFKIRNLIRDSVQSIAVSPLSYNPITNIKKGLAASKRGSQTYVSALASGGLIRFGTMFENRASDRVRQLVRMGAQPNTILDTQGKVAALTLMVEKGFMAYSDIGNRGEEINRAALYQEMKKQGLTNAEAAVMARDLLDFSMQGAWTSVRFLTQVVPFLNARIQGLYKLGKSAKEDPKRMAIVLGAVGLMSLMLMSMYHDDDDWKKREDWDRDNYWWFKVGGIAYRIPKPFEIGAIATLAERGIELLPTEFGGDKDMTPARFLNRVKSLLSDNLSMNPIPQAVKPILDIYSNKDSFTGRPIETIGMEKLAPEYRFNANTSMPARATSTAINTALSPLKIGGPSPVQVDHVIRGYLGWLGSFAVGGADMIARPLAGEPSRPAADMFKVASMGFASELPTGQSRYVTQLYEQAKILDEAYTTYQDLLKSGKLAEARGYLADHRDEIVRSRGFDQVKAAEARINERIRMIERSAMSPDDKKAQILRLNEQKDRIARLVTQPR